jgi:hypothetical protein
MTSTTTSSSLVALPFLLITFLPSRARGKKNLCRRRARTGKLYREAPHTPHHGLSQNAGADRHAVVA